MARLEWGATGERLFEAGVDRGVLYVNNGAGEAWSGITGITESNSNTTPRPFFIDGFKYLNLDSVGDFQATLTAFSAPSGFGACEGNTQLYAGLSITAQRRKEFHLAYRTMIGNDVSGTSFGYKIHLVYNCLASPSDSTHVTTGADVAPLIKSWSITTRPPMADGFRPTAHLVIDSRTADRVGLAYLEGILYGNEQQDARMPTVQEVLDIFQWETEYVGDFLRYVGSFTQDTTEYTNLLTNPSFASTSGTVEVARNRNPNPFFDVDRSGWSQHTTVEITPVPGVGIRMNAKSTAPGGTQLFYFTSASYVPLSGNEKCWQRFEVSVPIDAPRAIPVLSRLRIERTGGTQWTNSAPVWVAPGETKVIEHEESAHSDAIWFQAAIMCSSDQVWATGDSLIIHNGLTVQVNPIIRGIFAPGLPSPDPDLTPVWTGATQNSQSILVGQIPRTTDTFTYNFAYKTAIGSKVLFRGASSTHRFAFRPGSTVPLPETNVVYTLLIKFTAPKSYSGFTINFRNNTGTAAEQNTVWSGVLPKGTTELRVSGVWPSGTPSSAGWGVAVLGAMSDGDSYVVERALLVKGAYSGGYFNGDEPPKLRRNLATNPNATGAAEDNSYGLIPRWYGSGGSGSTTWGNVGSGIIGGPDTFARKKWNTVGSQVQDIAYGLTRGRVPVRAGDVISLSWWTRLSDIVGINNYNLFLQVFTHQVSGGKVQEVIKNLPLPTSQGWFRNTHTFTVTNDGFFGPYHYIGYNDPSRISSGSTIDATGLLVEVSSEAGTYFDGNLSEDPHYATEWEGTPNASPSYLYAHGSSVEWDETPHQSPSTLTVNNKLLGTEPKGTMVTVNGDVYVSDGVGWVNYGPVPF